MTKFQVGDIVVCNSRAGSQLLYPSTILGQRYTVDTVNANGIVDLIGFAGHTNYAYDSDYALAVRPVNNTFAKSRFKVGDHVICVVKKWPYEALNPPSVVGRQYQVSAVHQNSTTDLIGLVGHANYTMEDQYELATHLYTGTSATPKSFKSGDIVRLTQDIRRSSNILGTVHLFTADSEWEVITYDLGTACYQCRLLHTNTQTLLAWDEIELLSSVVVASQPALATPAPHTCQDNIAHYDSGWSRYDYCRVCDKKIVD